MSSNPGRWRTIVGALALLAFLPFVDVHLVGGGAAWLR